MAGQRRARTLCATGALALVAACSDATTTEAVPDTVPEVEHQSAMTEPPPETTTTTLSPELEVILEHGVRIPPTAALPPLLGIVAGPGIDIDDGYMPDGLSGAWDDPPGGCEGPLSLDADLLGPTVHATYGGDAFDSVEVAAVPIDDHTAYDVTARWEEQAETCTSRDVTDGPLSYRRTAVAAPGGPIVAAQIAIDRTLMHDYPEDRPDPPLVNTARWYGVVDDLLYSVHASGGDPADATGAVTALVAAIHGGGA